MNAIKLVKSPFGRVCLIGWMYGMDIKIDSQLFFGRWITRSLVFGLKDWKGLLRLMLNNDIHLEKIVTRYFPPGRAAVAYEIAGKRCCCKEYSLLILKSSV